MRQWFWRLVVMAVVLTAAVPGVARADSSVALVTRAVDLIKQGRLGDAELMLGGAIQANPRNPAAWAVRGELRAAQGGDRLRAALADYSKAIALAPRDGNLYRLRAEAYQKAGNAPAAAADLRKVAALGGQTAPAPVGRATGPAQRPAANGNLVEPLSNGVVMSMTKPDILQRFGQPPIHTTLIQCRMEYPGFTLDTCYGPRVARMWISAPGITLASGIKIGSTKSQVAGVFGNSYGGKFGPYGLEFNYNGEKVSNIKIDYDPPANGPAPSNAQADQARNNFYMNQQQLQNRLDQNGTIGYNPFRN